MRLSATKKIISIILIICLVFSLVACGNVSKVEENTPQNESAKELKEIYLLAYSKEIYYPGDVIIMQGSNTTVSVMADGHLYRNFEIINENENVASLKSNGAGAIMIERITEGTAAFSVRIDEKDFSFTLLCNKSGSSNNEKVIVQDDKTTIALSNKAGDVSFEIENKKYSVDYSKLISDLNSNRLKTATGTITKDDIPLLVGHQKGEVEITQAEIDSLRNKHDQHDVTYDQAVSDIDLLFRGFKYGFGGYYFLGENNFLAAKEAMLSDIKGKSSISFSEFHNIVSRRLDWIQNGHFAVGGFCGVNSNTIDYKYYYCNLNLGKDDKGYYCESNNEKWYYAGCDNPDVNIALHLTNDGVITYSPRLFCNKFGAHSSDVLKFSNGELTLTVKVTWAMNHTAPYSDGDYNFFNENGIGYVSIRTYVEDNFKSSLQQYVKDASLLRDAKLIILDLRGNGGGVEHYCKDWIKNLTGDTPSVREVITRWRNRLSAAPNTVKEVYDYEVRDPHIVKNNIPIVVLIDDNAYSSGESAFFYTRAVENCLVVGCNTGGAQRFGGSGDFYLPNSGLNIKFGADLRFAFDLNNVDLVGYEPDVWCDSSNVLDCVINMIKQYSIADVNLDSLRGYLKTLKN